MTKFVNQAFLDGGLNYLRNNCNSMVLLDAYTFGDSYATVDINVVAEAAMAPADFTLASAGNDRTITTASGKQDTAANMTGPASHIAFRDTVNSVVIWVTEETTGQTITAPNPVTFPSLVYTSRQPVAP